MQTVNTKIYNLKLKHKVNKTLKTRKVKLCTDNLRVGNGHFDKDCGTNSAASGLSRLVSAIISLSVIFPFTSEFQ